MSSRSGGVHVVRWLLRVWGQTAGCFALAAHRASLRDTRPVGHSRGRSSAASEATDLDLDVTRAGIERVTLRCNRARSIPLEHVLGAKQSPTRSAWSIALHRPSGSSSGITASLLTDVLWSGRETPPTHSPSNRKGMFPNFGSGWDRSTLCLFPC